jgi:acyl-CoA synthetase (AMP-forming)/AMP-acid ligase II
MSTPSETSEEVTREVREQLTGPGGPFEVAEETVLGAPMTVFKNRHRSLRELLQQSALHGDKEYMVYGDRRISYAEHVRLVASLAAALRDRYGVGAGDRVAILAANSPDRVIAWWATVSLGAVAVALNGWWTADEIEYGVTHSDPALLIGDRKRLARTEGLDLKVPTLEIESEFPALLEYAPDAGLPEQPIAEDDPCLILYTSGTTGRPKGAVCSHRGLVGFVQVQTMGSLERILIAMKSGHAPAPNPNPLSPAALVTTPLFHLSGLFAMAIMMLATGAKTVYREGRFDPEDVLRVIEHEKITIWSALGSAAPRVLADPALEKYDVSSVINIGFGGAPTSPSLQERVRKAFPSASSNIGMGYGLSESSGMGASIGGRELELHPTSTGRPAITHEIEIRDEDGTPMAEGDDGEIHIRSPYLMLEYWGDPEATAKALLPGHWLATGDVGHLRDGRLYINTRARDLILRAAENISPVEIEHRLDAHPSVQESAVVGVPHEELGQEVKAIVVPAPGAELDTQELDRWVAEALARFKVPSLWEVRTEALPRNPSGKVLKNVLSGEAENRFIEE